MSTELLFRENAYLKTATARVLAVHERGIELDRTIFYPQGGGQMGDTGALLRASGERIQITNTLKGDAIDSVVQVPVPAMPQPEPGETLTLEIDWERTSRTSPRSEPSACSRSEAKASATSAWRLRLLADVDFWK